MNSLPKHMVLSAQVAQAFKMGQPLVALESTVITHGLPRPQNLALAQDMEREIVEQGAVPATIAMIEGKIHVGLTPDELQFLANADGTRKISRRDFGVAIAQKLTGGTTVAGTLIAAHAAGVKVFATGGIGGVHRQAPFDISADLPELARTPLVVVCAGAKAILDLPATMEVLETYGVPVVGYQTREFPAFYSRSSGLPVGISAETPEEVAALAQAHWELGLDSAVLVGNPIPAAEAIPSENLEAAILQALDEAQAQSIRGSAVTPFLLGRVSQLSGGSSLKANLALLLNNARLGAQIARALTPRKYI